jgi:L-amino acid N-acyltransferase YncA
MPGAGVARGPKPRTAVVTRPMTVDDWPAVRSIYAQGIETGDATFETEVPDWETWNGTHDPRCRLVAVLGGEVVAWLALVPWSNRHVYRGACWESIYVAARARGRGVGHGLMAAALTESERAGIWTLIAGVFSENASSLALHDAAGFRRIGVQHAIGQDASGRWRDVVLLERRSTVIGRAA